MLVGLTIKTVVRRFLSLFTLPGSRLPEAMQQNLIRPPRACSRLGETTHYRETGDDLQ